MAQSKIERFNITGAKCTPKDNTPFQSFKVVIEFTLLDYDNVPMDIQGLMSNYDFKFYAIPKE